MAQQQYQDHDEEWRNDLCSHVCGGDCGTCMASWFCPCFLFGRTAERSKYFPSNDKEQYSLLNGDCCIYYLSAHCALNWIPLWMKRGEFRQRHHIKGSSCGDCMVSCFCTPCGLAQMESEVKDRSLSNAEINRSDGYKSEQGQMMYQQPMGN